MTFGLPGWLKVCYGELGYEVPIWYPTVGEPDTREWLLTNGLGGFANGTIAGVNTRRYHGLLIAPTNPPCRRHMVFNRIDERVEIDGQLFELATNYWAQGVVAPTGYRFLESFTILPCPTWVF